MNSYNDNLNSVVVASLQAQELENKQLNSQRIASMFSLYHAEGATITAFEKLKADQKTLGEKAAVQDQAVLNSNISTNMLASATQAGTYVAQSVTNTSVAAANTQVAGNAILKLAGDMGNIYSIVNAADFDTEIYKQGKEAMDLINQTAYLAEVATKTAMDASIKTSEVSTATVLSKAKATNTLMGNLLQIVTTDFNNVSALVTTDTANVAAASVVEKAAEGNYEDIVAEYRAARNVYKTANAQLNLGLTVSAVLLLGTNEEILATTAQDVSQRNIQFNLVTSPFAAPRAAGVPIPAGIKLTPDDNPVSDYYIMLVNEDSQSTFSITDAEGILLKGPGNFIKIHVTPSQLNSKTGSHEDQVFVPAVLTRTDNQQQIPVSEGRVSMTVDFFNVNGGKLKDSDGKLVKMGTKYVVFLMAVYDPNYKRKLNNFEDYLSASSNVFKLANILTPVTGVEAGPIKKKEDEKTRDSSEVWFPMETEGQAALQASKPDPDTYQITFSVSENPAYAADVEYRCIILPGEDTVNSGMLTRATMHDIEDEVTRLEQIADEFDSLIANTHDRLLSTRLNLTRIGFTPECQFTNPPTLSKQQNEFDKKFNQLNDKLLATKNGEEKKLLTAAIKVLSTDFKRMGFIPSFQATTPSTTSVQQEKMNADFNEIQEKLEQGIAKNDEAAIATYTAKSKEMKAKFRKMGFTPAFQVTTPSTTVKQQAEYNKTCNALNDEYVKALNDKAKALADIQQHTADNFSFLFNLKLAEQVSAGNYILPSQYTIRNNVTGYQWPVTDYIAPFGPGTTDNFGNPLISGRQYTVVVLSISTAEEQNLPQYINNWTGANTPVVQFTYTEPVKAGTEKNKSEK